MGERATKAQLLERVDFVYKLLLDGRDTADILELVREKWNVAETTAAYYITKANKDLRSLSNASKKEIYEFVLSNLKDLLIETRRDKNYTCFLGALSQISKITGLERMVIEWKDEAPEVDTHNAIEELEDRSSSTLQ